MKAVQQNYGNGQVSVVEVPEPALRSGCILVRNRFSVVSAGTELAMIDLGRRSLLGKARARPDLVKQVVDKARTEGVLEAYRAARQRLDTPIPLGYSCAGEVTAVGRGAEEFSLGEMVACFGSGFASHAGVVSVPKNLAAAMPRNIAPEDAAFAGLGAIALHGVRSLNVGLGSRVGVIGLGLLGLLAVQLLRAAGCRVMGVDVNPSRVQLAHSLGADVALSVEGDVQAQAVSFSDGHGLDAVLVLAAASSAAPLNMAAEIVRRGGTVSVPGLVELTIPRRLFYEKEIRFVVPRAAGPGIYDPSYERQGQDYPIEYVRWTAGRNLRDFLEQVSIGTVKVAPLVTHRFPIERGEDAYDLLINRREPTIGIVLEYPLGEGLGTGDWGRGVGRIPNPQSPVPSPSPLAVGVGAIGAGLFGRTVLLPALKGQKNVNLRGLATASGISARHSGERFGFSFVTTDYYDVLRDEQTQAVLVLTRHNQHARQTVEALELGKCVFVEKPLATTVEELTQVCQAASGSRGWLMVGFNRRFSPFTLRAVEALSGRATPCVVGCRINAGFVPQDSWVQDREEGAGRVIGEVCHYVDLIHALTGALTEEVYARGVPPDGRYAHDENLAVTLRLSDGSVGSIVYTAMGHKSFPRERVEVFWGDNVCLIDNFRSLTLRGPKLSASMKRWNVDRGHRGELSRFLKAVREGSGPPVPLENYARTTLATFAILESLSSGRPVAVGPLPISRAVNGV
jgi:predicted dehydrogenase/threonine dehydrogenase-like Zn-dependent dehydrogenase